MAMGRDVGVPHGSNDTPGERTLSEQLSRAFLSLAGLVALGFVTLAVLYSVCYIWLTPHYRQSLLASKAEQSAFAAMLDQESGARAFAQTGDSRFLDPYHHGVPALAQANNLLIRSLGPLPELGALMGRTSVAEERWAQDWAGPVTDPNPSGAALPSLLQGKVLFDTYRREREALSKALDQRVTVLGEREQIAVNVRVGMVLVIFVIVFTSCLRRHRNMHSLIVEPVNALLDHITHIREGALDSTFTGKGPREIRQIGFSLNELARALAAAQATSISRDASLRHYTSQLRLILDASREFSETLNLKHVVSTVRACTAAIGGSQQVNVWLIDGQQKLIDWSGDVTGGTALSPVDVGVGLAGRAAKAGRVTLEAANGYVRFANSDSGPISAIAVPLIVGARVVGVLQVRLADPRPVDAEQIEIIELIAIQAATAIESARLHEIVEERSQKDTLTKLFNRRRLEEDLTTEWSRCVRYARPLAFVMIDVDHFKAHNDAIGHPKADRALQTVAEIILKSTRVSDTAYRYGGEEFCVLMRETTPDDAIHFAERVREQIERHFAAGECGGLTASLGVSGFTHDMPMAGALIEAADAALYESKRTGRNRVTLSAGPSATAARS